MKGKREYNYVEKRAEKFGGSAHVILPVEWTGKIVRVAKIE